MFKTFFTEYCPLVRNNWAPKTFSIKTKRTKKKKKNKEQKKTKKKLLIFFEKTIDFWNDDILRMIRNVPPNISHRHDGKIFDNFIWKLLNWSFSPTWKTQSFPVNEKAYMGSVHLKVSNYWEYLPTNIINSYHWENPMKYDFNLIDYLISSYFL